MARAQDETMSCDLFIVLGSSLVVYPAAGFPRIAKRKGAKLVIVNRDPTDQDDDADLRDPRRDRADHEQSCWRQLTAFVAGRSDAV